MLDMEMVTVRMHIKLDDFAPGHSSHVFSSSVCLFGDIPVHFGGFSDHRNELLAFMTCFKKWKYI